MKKSDSIFVDVRGLRYHVRRWGRADAPRLYMLHGWMDVSASFQFVVDALEGDWCVYAPDWRGFGDTQWSGAASYWFPDYLADLDQLLAQLQPDAPVTLLGHSMGGNVACLYAGIRPARVSKLINLEGLGVAARESDESVSRHARWLDELQSTAGFSTYADFAALAQRLARRNPRLSPARADFLARCWGRQAEAGRVVLRGDPAHKRVNPLPWNLADAMACWRNVRADVLWIEGCESGAAQRLNLTAADLDARRRCFASLRVERIAAAGHMLHHDQPEAVARAIERFLAES